MTKQNTIRTRIDTFVADVMQANKENTNAIKEYDKSLSELKAQHSELEAKKARVGAEGTEEEYLRVRTDLTTNEGKQEFAELKKARLSETWQERKPEFSERYNELNTENYLDALKKALPLYMQIKDILEEAQGNEKALAPITSISSWINIHTSVPGKRELITLATKVTEDQLRKMTELVSDDKNRK